MTSRQILAAAVLMATAGPAAAQSDVELPYWASISVDEARMRKGPSPEVPVMWEYRRKDLPVKVIARHETWRRANASIFHEPCAFWVVALRLDPEV